MDASPKTKQVTAFWCACSWNVTFQLSQQAFAFSMTWKFIRHRQTDRQTDNWYSAPLGYQHTAVLHAAFVCHPRCCIYCQLSMCRAVVFTADCQCAALLYLLPTVNVPCCCIYCQPSVYRAVVFTANCQCTKWQLNLFRTDRRIQKLLSV